MRTEAAKRVELIFTLLDVNGNGVIDSDDFDLMTARVLKAATASDDSARTAIQDAFRNYWTKLSTELDTNGDGVITVEEFRPFVLDPQRFGPTITEFAQALSALGDPDKDGLIERPLFVALLTAIGFEEANTHAVFDAFAPDTHDRIPVATFAAGIKDYYAPEKAGIPGDLMVTAPHRLTPTSAGSVSSSSPPAGLTAWRMSKAM
jgi:Ca2+-binding EF-hand superfamily protein